MKEFTISKKFVNKDVYSVILKTFPHLATSALNKVFRVKDVKVNDARVNKDYILHENDVVKIYLNDNVLFGLPEQIHYAYEDDNILVAYKPKGVVSNYEGADKYKNTLVPYFDELVKKEKGNDIIICHRLDTNTEGLVIFAKNKLAHEQILNAFTNNYITKEYLALVHGKPPKMQDTISNYILKDDKTGYSKIVDKPTKNAKSCITEYTVIKYFKALNCSTISLKLHTGRTHQIRAHMKYIGCPVIGDSKYSTNTINNRFKTNSQLLFAIKYTFSFPKTSQLDYLNNTIIDVKSDALDKIQDIVNKLK